MTNIRDSSVTVHVQVVYLVYDKNEWFVGGLSSTEDSYVIIQHSSQWK